MVWLSGLFLVVVSPNWLEKDLAALIFMILASKKRI